MRANDQPTWRALAEPLVLVGGLLGVVPFMMLLIVPLPLLDQLYRPGLWVAFGLWVAAQSTLSTWALMTERARPPVSPPRPRRRRGIIDLAARRRDRDRVERRLEQLRGRTTG